MATRQLTPAPEPSYIDRPVVERLPRTDWRAACALLLGLAALLAALGAAHGPAISEQAELAWPPSRLPASSPTRTWITPMLLARHSAQSLRVSVPCGRVHALPGAGRTVVLFATARRTRAVGGLQIVRGADGATSVWVGPRELAHVSALASPGCVVRVGFNDRTWSVSQTGGRTQSGTVPDPPQIYGLLTELDLRSQPSVLASVRPIPQDTRSSTTQTLLRAIGLLLVAAAVVVVVGTPSLPRLSRPHLAAQDAFVILVLAVWWLLAPLQSDDGWVRARETNWLVSGGMSNYFTDWGANLPLGTWLEWLQHLVVTHTTSLALWRLPALLALVGGWIVCRWCLVHLTGRRASRNDLAWWTAALVFSTGGVSFGMTLRAEPLISLLSVAVLASCLAYARSRSIGPLAAAVLLTTLAATIYPSAIVAAAPLAVCAPLVFREAGRRIDINPLTLAALVSVGAAGAALLVFVDFDLRAWRDNDTLLRSGSHWGGVFQELDRYRHLADPGASPIRRLFVMLMAFAVVAFVAGLVRRRPLERLLPSASVTLGLLFLVGTPSKWIWHFGGLIGLLAVTLGVEAHRLSSTPSSRRGRAALVVAVLAVTVAATTVARSWGVLDIGRLDWNHRPGLFLTAGLLAIVAVLLAGYRGLLLRVDLVVLPAVLASVLGLTIFLFATDAAATKGWTPARQSVSSLVGRSGCGLADSIDVAVTRPTGPRWVSLTSLMNRPGVRSLVSPVLFNAVPCARLPALKYGVAEPPDLIVDFHFCTDASAHTCTFKGVPNVLRVQRLRLRAPHQRGFINAYRVGVDPRDAIAPATRTVIS